MKRILSLTLAVLAALSLVACQERADDVPDDDVTRTEFELVDSVVVSAILANDTDTVLTELGADYLLYSGDDELIAEADGHELTVTWSNAYYDGQTTIRYVAYSDGSDLDAALVSQTAVRLTGVALPEAEVSAYLERAVESETTNGGTVVISNDDETISLYVGAIGTMRSFQVTRVVR